MALGKLWAGRLFGTNTGNVFIKLEGDDAALEGAAHFNDPTFGMAVYSIKAVFDGRELNAVGSPQVETEGVTYGKLSCSALLGEKGELRGEWSTTIGSAGTIVLYPHGPESINEDGSFETPDQLHVARHSFGAIEVTRPEIISIAEEIQREFKVGKLVVTVTTSTEQSRFLDFFRDMKFVEAKAKIIKLYVQEPELNGVNRVVHVEFGPHINLAMTQGSDEAWVLGMLEKIKVRTRPLERTYATSLSKYGFGINQLMLAATLVVLPGMPGLRDRAIMVAAVCGLIWLVNRLHGRFLLFADIYLDEKPLHWYSKIGSSVLSWLIAVLASVVATLVAAYLQGWLKIP